MEINHYLENNKIFRPNHYLAINATLYLNILEGTLYVIFIGEFSGCQHR